MLSSFSVTVCCCGSLAFLRLGGRKERPLCHLCVGAAAGAGAGKPEKAGAGLEWAGDSVKMHRSALRPAAMVGGVTMLRPPKPPCWRDFVSHDPRKESSFSPCNAALEPRGTVDIQCTSSGVGGPEYVDSQVAGVGRPQYSVSGGVIGLPKASKPGKRLRARIRRTRSEHLIQVEDLPEGDLTVSLAETRPHELRLRVPPAAELDERLYEEENNRRCQSWLASIEAAEPLDDIGYTLTKTDSSLGLEQVDVEVPEETFLWEDGWEDEGVEAVVGTADLQPPFNTSASSSDSGGGGGVMLQRALTTSGSKPPPNFDDGDVREVVSDVDGGRATPGDLVRKLPRSLNKGKCALRSTVSSRNIHNRVSSQHILAIPEHASID